MKPHETWFVLNVIQTFKTKSSSKKTKKKPIPFNILIYLNPYLRHYSTKILAVQTFKKNCSYLMLISVKVDKQTLKLVLTNPRKME